MKKAILLTVLFFSILSFSQPGTTEREYNYFTKGYADDLAKGKDIIAGYQLTLIDSHSAKTNDFNVVSTRKTEIYKFVRTDTNSFAGLLIINTRLENGNKTFFCIPNKNTLQSIEERAINDYYQEIKKYKCDNEGAAYAYSWNYLKLLCNLVSKQ